MKVTKTFTIKVSPAIEQLDISGNFPDETVGAPVTGGVTATGGVPPVSFAVTNGSLPPGVNLDSATGTLSGTPTVAGDATFEVTATDSGV